MLVWRTITTPRAIGFGLALASAGLLVMACTNQGSPVDPSAPSRSGAAVVTDAALEGLHRHHTARTGLEEELAQVRQATAPYHRVEAAMAAGYELGYVNGSGIRIINGCVAHPTAGAMGYHYLKKTLINDLLVDPLKPEGLVYAPGLRAMEWAAMQPTGRAHYARGAAS